MLTCFVLQANFHAYADVAGLIWSYPIKEVNRYIEAIESRTTIPLLL